MESRPLNKAAGIESGSMAGYRMEPIGEGKGLENPSVPCQKTVLEAAECGGHGLCRQMPGHGSCH